MKRFSAILILLSILLCFASCDDGKPKAQTFTHECGITITLNEAFREDNAGGYDVVYESSDATVFVLKEEFSEFDGFGDYSATQYGELVRAANSNNKPTELANSNGIIYFEYGYFYREQKIEYKYLTAVFKGKDAFFSVQFAATADKYPLLKETFLTFAESVSFE